MNRTLHLVVVWFAILAVSAGPAVAQESWSTAQAENLLRWIDRASDEGITLPGDTKGRLRASIDEGDTEHRAEVANDAAMTLLRAWRGRCCGQRRPDWWHISEEMSDAELIEGLEQALAEGRLDLHLRSVRPHYPQYDALVAALAREEDAARRALITQNLARWRWMPAKPGKRFLLVNIASQQLELWQDNEVIERWRVIIGKPVTRTPVFTAQVSGIVFNPWWNIPSSIAAEGIASFVQRNPAAARAKGYIFQHGRYRQMPGDNNALGRMKLVMPNPYSVFLHDTSNSELFAEERRAFSHGCVRVDRALSFAASLLSADGWEEKQISEIIESDETQTVFLSRRMPLYIVYFTVEPADDGAIVFHEDIYGRDRNMGGGALGGFPS